MQEIYVHDCGAGGALNDAAIVAAGPIASTGNNEEGCTQALVRLCAQPGSVLNDPGIDVVSRIGGALQIPTWWLCAEMVRKCWGPFGRV